MLITKQHGFTLIELLVTIAILGIISAIAIPAYNNYLVRGKVSEAFAGLSDQRLRQEQYYADNRNYGAAGAACPAANPPSKYFDFVCAVNTPAVVGTPTTSYSITATSKVGQGLGAAGDYVYTLAVASTGVVIKGTTKFAGNAVAIADWMNK